MLVARFYATALKWVSKFTTLTCEGWVEFAMPAISNSSKVLIFSLKFVSQLSLNISDYDLTRSWDFRLTFRLRVSDSEFEDKYLKNEDNLYSWHLKDSKIFTII